MKSNTHRFINLLAVASIALAVTACSNNEHEIKVAQAKDAVQMAVTQIQSVLKTCGMGRMGEYKLPDFTKTVESFNAAAESIKRLRELQSTEGKPLVPECVAWEIVDSKGKFLAGETELEHDLQTAAAHARTLERSSKLSETETLATLVWFTNTINIISGRLGGRQLYFDRK